MKIAFYLLILLFSFTSQNVSSQTLKEKMEAKLQEQRNKSQKKNSSEIEVTDGESIKVIAKRWESDCAKTLYKPMTGSSSGKFERRGIRQMQFIKDSDGNIIAIHTGGNRDEHGNIIKPAIYEPYDYEASDFTEAYFKDHMHVLYLTNESMVEYTLDKDYNVKSITSVCGKTGKRVKGWISEIQAYRDYRDVRVAADREARKQAEIANRAKYTLEGKTVTDIKVVYIGEEPTVAEVGSTMKFGLEITLADGTKDKTQNIGGNLYIEDFKSNYKHLEGVGGNYHVGKWGGHCHCYNAMATFYGDTKLGEKDVTNITIESKYGGNGKALINLPIQYQKTREFDYAGRIYVYVKKVKHSETGETLFQCKVAEEFVKLREGGALIINANGSMGAPGSTGCCDKYSSDDKIRPGPGGDGGNGTDGGNVYLIKDPNLKGSSFQFTAYVEAGLAGPAGSGGKCWNCLYGQHGESGRPGQPGIAGSLTEKTEKVTF